MPFRTVAVGKQHARVLLSQYTSPAIAGCTVQLVGIFVGPKVALDLQSNEHFTAVSVSYRFCPWSH